MSGPKEVSAQLGRSSQLWVVYCLPSSTKLRKGGSIVGMGREEWPPEPRKAGPLSPEMGHLRGAWMLPSPLRRGARSRQGDRLSHTPQQGRPRLEVSPA